jgi:uncharacterized membrane protein YczE
MNNYIKSSFFYALSAFGIGLTIKANVGVSSINSLNLAIANASLIKVGTITIIINVVFLLLYMYLTQFKHKKKYLIQMIAFASLGILINFFTYVVLKDFVIETYFYRVLLLSFGTTMGGLSVGMIINYDVTALPIESFCIEIAKITKFNFLTLRYSIDVASVIISLLISLSFSLPLYVREGTIISLILFTASMNLVKSKQQLKKAA